MCVLCLVTQSCSTLWTHGLQHARLLSPWDSLSKNTGVGYHALLQGMFPTQRSNLGQIPIILNTRKGKFICNRKQIGGCLEREVLEEAEPEFIKRHKEFWRNKLTTWLWFHRGIHLSKLIKLYTLNTCNLFFGSIILQQHCLKKKKKCTDPQIPPLLHYSWFKKFVPSFQQKAAWLFSGGENLFSRTTCTIKNGNTGEFPGRPVVTVVKTPCFHC